MDEAARLIAASPPHGTAVTAERQTAGRGRAPGSRWRSAAGANLLLTLMLRRDRTAAAPATVPLRAGCALAEVAAALGLAPSIKWPNDLLVGGRKLAGVLCTAADGWLLVGVVVNCNQRSFPPDAGAATSLALCLRRSVDRARVEREVLEALRRLLQAGDWLDRLRGRLAGVGRAARVVARHAPPGVEEISVVLRAYGTDLTTVPLIRRHLEDMALGSGSPEETLRSARFERPRPLPPDALNIHNDHAYPRFDWGLNPSVRHHVGAPEHPYLFQLRALLSSGVEVLPGLRASADIGFDIYNEYHRISRGPKGQLEPVRTNVKEYLQRGEHVLAGAQTDYVFSLAPDWYARAAAGYFESMFGGVSGEVLYRRQDSRWAAGVEVSHVWQRDFDQLLGFRDYDTTTGHVSLYYKLPWHDLEAAVHGGRYLARDWGATFQLSRRFRSGIEFGGFFTLTNVSDAEFGEGGFDKGLFLRVPLNLLLPYSTRKSVGTIFRPLTSDGGQMLVVGPKLYDVTEEGQLDALHRRPLGLRD